MSPDLTIVNPHLRFPTVSLIEPSSDVSSPLHTMDRNYLNK